MFLETLDMKFNSTLLEDIFMSNEYVVDNLQTMINSRSHTPTMDHIFEGVSTITSTKSKFYNSRIHENYVKGQTKQAIELSHAVTSDSDDLYNQSGATFFQAEDGIQNSVEMLGITRVLFGDFDLNKLIQCYKNTYVEEVYETLKQRYRIGRFRTMMCPGPYAYTLHKDFGKRLHIPVFTNKHVHFLDGDKNLYQMPEVTKNSSFI